MVDKPSNKEEEYFKKLEIERMKKFEAERLAKMAEEHKQKLKDLHHMKCPKCGMDLIEIEYGSVILDRCVSCSGTWFDSGELERLLTDKDSTFFGKLISIFK